jgi:Flp pilus assembly protein TadD
VNLDQAQQTLEAWVRTYPDDPTPHGALASHVYRSVGQFERSVAESRKAIELKTDLAIVHFNLAAGLSYLGRYPEARQVLAAARKRGFEIDEFLMLRHDLAFLVGDREEMKSVVAQARGRSVAENWISENEARALAWAGRLREARDVSGRALEQARHAATRAGGSGKPGQPSARPYSGMLAKRRHALRKPSNSPPVARWNLEPPSLWRLPAIQPEAKRSQATWNGDSPTIPPYAFITCRWFAHFWP